MENAFITQEGSYWYRLTAWNAYGWSEDVIAGPCVITHVPELCDEDVCMAYTDCKGQPGHGAHSQAGHHGLHAGAHGAALSHACMCFDGLQVAVHRNPSQPYRMIRASIRCSMGSQVLSQRNMQHVLGLSCLSSRCLLLTPSASDAVAGSGEERRQWLLGLLTGTAAVVVAYAVRKALRRRKRLAQQAASQREVVPASVFAEDAPGPSTEAPPAAAVNGDAAVGSDARLGAPPPYRRVDSAGNLRYERLGSDKSSGNSSGGQLRLSQHRGSLPEVVLHEPRGEHGGRASLPAGRLHYDRMDSGRSADLDLDARHVRFGQRGRADSNARSAASRNDVC